MDKKEFQVKMLFYLMLKSLDEIVKVDEELQEEMKGFEAKIQWKIGNFTGYQVFKDEKYSWVIDKEIEDPDVTMTIRDLDVAKDFFTGELDGTSAYMSGVLQIEGNLLLTMTYNSLAEYIMDYLKPLIEG
ncbi:MAG: SCP2 sterol-binding domain-containing protein [Candidatus Lokiarchaeota archaeon]|nr:SCP2 sterol-binding domain-containing protein [Candidatus Lokiarchaeota archaeon]